MARRVKQADGSYCYTENCRIHDRSLSDSTGLQAVIADAREAQRQVSFSQAAKVITKILKVDSLTAKELSEKALTAAAHHHLGVTPYTIATELHKAGDEKGLDTENWNSFDASYAIHSNLVDDSIIKTGDEVILNETGERGRIAEGHTGFGGVVRFNPEDHRSRNSFAWFGAEAITKIPSNQDGLARQQIVSAPRDALIPVSLVEQMMAEETNPRTRNAQASRVFSNSGNVETSKQMLRWFAADLRDERGDRGITKSALIKAIKKSIDTPYPGQDHATGSLKVALEESKAGLRNILAYLHPKKSF